SYFYKNGSKGACGCQPTPPLCLGLWTFSYVYGCGCAAWVPLRRAAHRQAVHAQRRHANAYRHTLAFLAAGTYAGVQPHVVADHAYASHGVRTIADERRPLDRRSDTSVLDQIGLGRRENELPASDIHLAAAEI